MEESENGVPLQIVTGSGLDHSGSNSSNNGSSSAHRSFSRVNTVPAGRTNSCTLEPDSSPNKLERSKTERQQPKNLLASEAAQIFDNNIPIQQKVCSFNC